ncbi:MAG: lysylphosphatidylglycerol synthase transmembrane domain-containing protein [Bryobacterales bacterium]|nr:lysylphosphatidylglycerol synthase transmembrane domain-containing protein [Bryobacterales bacterium]
MMVVTFLMLFGSGKSRRKFPSWLLPAVGCLISGGALYWTFHGVELSAVARDLAATSWGWVPLAALADLFVYVWQSWRWNLLLAPIAQIPLWRSIRAIYVGLFVNEILPMRPGELLRAYLQARWSGLPFSVSLSSVVIERFFDGIWLFLVTFAATFFVRLPGHIEGLARALLIVLLAAAAVLVVINFRRQKSGQQPEGWLRVLLADLRVMARSPLFYWSFLASLPYLLLQAAPIYFLLKAYGLELSLGASLVVVLMQRLGTALPQAPGNVGVLQLMTKQALALFGVDETTAAGFSMLAWIVITAPLLLAGSVAVIVTGMRISELKRHVETLSPTPVGPPSR